MTVCARVVPRYRQAILHSPGCPARCRKDHDPTSWRDFSTLQHAEEQLRAGGFMVGLCLRCGLWLNVEAGLAQAEVVELPDRSMTTARPARSTSEARRCAACGSMMILERRPGAPVSLCPGCSGRPVKRLIALWPPDGCD